MKGKLPDGWEVKKLNHVITHIEAGTSVNCDDREPEHGDKSVLKLSAVSQGIFIESERKVVSRSEHSRIRTPVRGNKVLFTRKNTPELVGDSAFVERDHPDVYLPDLIWELSLDSGVDPRWLNHWFQSYGFRKNIPSIAAGSSQSMVGISKENLLDLQILLPTKSARERITSTINTWDQAIAQTERLIVLKRQRFNKLRTNVFEKISCQHRKRSLSELLVPAPKRRPEKLAGKKLLTVRLHCQGVEANESQLPRETANGRPYYERFAGDLIVGRQNFHNGGIGIVPKELEGYIASNAISSFRAKDNEIHVEYVCHFISMPNFYQSAEILMGGTGQKELSEAEFLNLEIPVPLPSIQLAVSNLLNTLQQEMRNLDLQQENWVTQKRGLMQKLLTGEWQLDARFDPSAPEAVGGPS